MRPVPFEFEIDDLPWLIRALRRQARTYRAGSMDEADVLISQTLQTGIAELPNKPAHLSLYSWLLTIMCRHHH